MSIINTRSRSGPKNVTIFGICGHDLMTDRDRPFFVSHLIDAAVRDRGRSGGRPSRYPPLVDRTARGAARDGPVGGGGADTDIGTLAEGERLGSNLLLFAMMEVSVLPK